ncbi:MAG: hypothetical protein J1E40_00010 [Oscillospiraceae bacterium]|nr:hypothetical protein [Oscillospiraceae bacterium]
MAHYNDKASAADTAAVWAIVFLAVVLAALTGIYFARQHGFDILSGNKASAEGDTTHINVIEPEIEVITPAETTEPVPEITLAAEVSETETEAPTETTIPGETVQASSEYDASFFDRVLMVGDSLSVGLVNYGYLKPENVFAQVGLTPASVMTTDINGESVYTKAAGLNPGCICIMLGTNGLSYLSEDYMAERMGVFIDELRKTCPDALIVLISIPPVTAAHESEKPEKIENITAYNSHIEKLAGEKSALYVDVFSLLKDSTGYLADHYAENDGLHFKTYAYPVILSAVQTAAEGLVPETVAVIPPVTAAAVPAVTEPATVTVTETIIETVTETVTETFTETTSAVTEPPAEQTEILPPTEILGIY